MAALCFYDEWQINFLSGGAGLALSPHARSQKEPIILPDYCVPTVPFPFFFLFLLFFLPFVLALWLTLNRMLSSMSKASSHMGCQWSLNDLWSLVLTLLFSPLSSPTYKMVLWFFFFFLNRIGGWCLKSGCWHIWLVLGRLLVSYRQCWLSSLLRGEFIPLNAYIREEEESHQSSPGVSNPWAMVWYWSVTC